MNIIPETCIGCGLCCMETPIMKMKEPKPEIKELYEIRGLTFRKINNIMFLMSPKCVYLTEHRTCSINDTKPNKCKTDKRGGMTCRATISMLK